MSATVYYEPHRLPAGILAVVVHSVFFALLYFGFNWNRQTFSPPTMSVELWPSLPEEAAAPPASPRVEEVVQPPPPQQKVAEPDIVMPDKRKVPVKPVEARPEIKKPVARPVEAVKPRPDTAKPIEPDPEARRLADEQAARTKAEGIRQEELAAATGRVVDEYKAKIKAKIRNNIVWRQQDVPDDMRAEFLVTLLPGGAVLPPKLIKSSGNAAYDNAVERAIRKSDPLPLPPDVALFNRFRELDLTFKPEKQTE
ncbi:MAG TPA: TonB C-terminal domain-containing protein [Gallionella sp.]|nr:TonB C-terminal domain-containing protein [Gallionella sp.]